MMQRWTHIPLDWSQQLAARSFLFSCFMMRSELHRRSLHRHTESVQLSERERFSERSESCCQTQVWSGEVSDSPQTLVFTSRCEIQTLTCSWIMCLIERHDNPLSSRPKARFTENMELMMLQCKQAHKVWVQSVLVLCLIEVIHVAKCNTHTLKWQLRARQQRSWQKSKTAAISWYEEAEGERTSE